MEIKIYQGDWFYNLGIIGFLNIMDNANKLDKVNIHENYITFQSEDLADFHEAYFNYFMQKYNVCTRVKQTLEMRKNYIIAHPDKLKDTVKKLKEDIKKNADKIRKFNVEDYIQLDQVMKELVKIQSMDEIKELEGYLKSALEIIGKPENNNRLTANLYKSIMAENYFGQVSFFNVSKATLDIDGLKQVMFKDYISDIVDYGKLMDYLEQSNLEDLETFISECLVDKEFCKGNLKKLFGEIGKKLKKKESIENIKIYLKSDELESCSLCGEFGGTTEDYTESHFIPLAISSGNARNMFWDFNLNQKVCAICKLILFCTPAGATYVRKYYLTEAENEFYTFVNIDTSMSELRRANINLEQSKDKEAPFKEIIMNMLEENVQQSKWQLQNILFMEFKASYDAKKCTLNYFNMPIYLTKFFIDSKHIKVLENIYNTRLKGLIVDDLLKERDLKYLIIQVLKQKLSDEIDGQVRHGIIGADCYRIVEIRYIINQYKRGENKVDDRKLKAIRFSAEEIRSQYVADNAVNKINGLAYRLLNTAKARNKKDFMDTILRIYISAQKNVPTLFLDVMAEKELDFDSIAYAFISGLVSEKYEPSKEIANK